MPVLLKVGAEKQQIEVHGDAALVQSSITSLGHAVMEREILDLPLERRRKRSVGSWHACRGPFRS